MPGKPLGHFINISLTPHYNPIIQPMFTAILVSLMWSEPFFLFYLFIYFMFEFITSTLPCWNSCSSVMKNPFPSVPTQTVRTVCSPISGLIRVFLFPLIYSSLCYKPTCSCRAVFIECDLSTADSSQRRQRCCTNHRSPRSRRGRPRSRSRRHTATVWRCICFWSRQTDSTSMRSLQVGTGEKLQ